MNYKELASAICEIRCNLENLAEEVNQMWIEYPDSEIEDCYLREIAYALQDAADSIAEYEELPF